MLETKEITLVSEAAVLMEHCPSCGSVVEMVSPHYAARISGTSERGIFRLIEQGVFHYLETDRMLVCVNSLKAMKKGEI